MTGMCPLCQANVSSFWPDVSTFRPNVSTLAGDVSSFWRGGLVGDGARTEGEIRSFGKLRTGFGRLRTGLFGRLAMNARGVGSQGCGPGFDLTGRG